MKTLTFIHESLIEATPAEVFSFHERPDALALLIPPWEKTIVVQPPASLAAGTVVILKTRLFPGFWQTIEAVHTGCVRDLWFEDTMRRGPFPHWRHRHRFLADDRGCLMRDEIEYAPPLGLLGRLADPVAIRPRLIRMFQYRHEVTRREVLAGHRPG